MIKKMIKKIMFPQPDKERKEWCNLNGTWNFSFDKPIYDRKIKVPYSWTSPISGIGEECYSTAFYQKKILWNPQNERIFLCFGAVDYICTVYVNGHKMTEHIGGYDRFDIDVTEVWSRNSENEISLSVTDSNSRSKCHGKQDYGDVCGIWQTVWLESRSNAYIEDFFVRTSMDGTISYEITTMNAKDGTEVTAEFGDISAGGTVKDGTALITFSIDNPSLWSPDNPYLYEGTLSVDNDIVYTYFGIREIGTGKYGTNKRNYITLNGKPLFINGVLDQSYNPDGFFTLPSDDDCREDIERLKNLGINMARIHVKAEEPLKLYWADKLGLLIMEDMPCFWGEPTEYSKIQFEVEMEKEIRRDRNHPSIIYWVVFNETWGLFNTITKEDGTEEKVYSESTADWVVNCFNKVRKLDPTRLIEDNSPTFYDHTITDVNTWHFYSNGYQTVKKVISEFCDNAYIGSTYNYRDGYAMTDVPCMNSECGNVWGVEGNAGESDISWQYKYMINEFRLHDVLCGFVFTEFHDVVNEFNGLYKIDNEKKDFGYSEYEMSLNDLHSQDFVGADFPPMKTVCGGDNIEIPLFISSFSDENHNKSLWIEWKLKVCNPTDGIYFRIADSGSYEISISDYGVCDAGKIKICAPKMDATAILVWELHNPSGRIMTNGVAFDIQNKRNDVLTVEPENLCSKNFERTIYSIQNNKVSGLKSGEFFVDINCKDIPGLEVADSLEILFEASSRKPMTHDYIGGDTEQHSDLEFFGGYKCDPGENKNSFAQTDEILYPSSVEALIDDIPLGKTILDDCPADTRGMLSHHYQATDNLLDEAGSYGYLCRYKISKDIISKIKKNKKFTFTLRTDTDCGLSIFGRKSGRYPIGIVLTAN